MAETEIELFKKGISKLKKGKFLEAIKVFDDLILSHNQKISVICNNNFNFSEWEFINEISSCEKKIKKAKLDFNGLLALSLLFKIVGNNDRRISYIREAIKQNSFSSRLWKEYGETAFQLGDINLALQHFQEAVNLNPKDDFSLEAIGLCYYYLDEPVKAIHPLEKALALDSNNHSIMNHLAFVYSEIGELDKAHELILKAIKLDESNNNYLDTYATILFLEEEYDQSLKVFEKILNNNPKDDEVSWDILSNLYSIMGLHAKAKKIEEKIIL